MREAPKVKVRCPVCRSVTYKHSIEELLHEVEEMWKPWQEYLSLEQRKKIAEMNTEEKLEKILAEEGEIKMFCPVCQFTTSIQIAEKIKREEASAYLSLLEMI